MVEPKIDWGNVIVEIEEDEYAKDVEDYRFSVIGYLIYQGWY